MNTFTFIPLFAFALFCVKETPPITKCWVYHLVSMHTVCQYSDHSDTESQREWATRLLSRRVKEFSTLSNCCGSLLIPESIWVYTSSVTSFLVLIFNWFHNLMSITTFQFPICSLVKYYKYSFLDFIGFSWLLLFVE